MTEKTIQELREKLETAESSHTVKLLKDLIMTPRARKLVGAGLLGTILSLPFVGYTVGRYEEANEILNMLQDFKTETNPAYLKNMEGVKDRWDNYLIASCLVYMTSSIIGLYGITKIKSSKEGETK